MTELEAVARAIYSTSHHVCCGEPPADDDETWKSYLAEARAAVAAITALNTSRSSQAEEDGLVERLHNLARWFSADHKTDAAATISAAADALNILATKERVMREALEKIAGGFIDSGFVESNPPNWHLAFDQLQELARTALGEGKK